MRFDPFGFGAAVAEMFKCFGRHVQADCVPARARLFACVCFGLEANL